MYERVEWIRVGMYVGEWVTFFMGTVAPCLDVSVYVWEGKAECICMGG